MITHVIKRGSRGMSIVEDDNDRYRYLKSLYFLNDANHPTPWERDVNALGAGLHFNRPPAWPGEREPYVTIYSYCLHDNHHHLLLEEKDEDGIQRFMKSLGSSMTQSYNERHGTTGSIFQGRPKKKIVENEEYMRLLYVYINVKNPFEKTPGGLSRALKHFDEAFEFALSDNFSSLADIMGKRKSKIMDTTMFNTLFSSSKDFKEFARDQMQRYQIFLNTLNAKDLE